MKSYEKILELKNHSSIYSKMQLEGEEPKQIKRNSQGIK